MTYHYKTRGTCSQSIDIELEGDIIKSVVFQGGCNGNLKGITALVRGASAKEVIEKCRGITCGMKRTSCPDQLAQALTEALTAQK